jgi:hypothetical protein
MNEYQDHSSLKKENSFCSSPFLALTAAKNNVLG